MQAGQVLLYASWIVAVNCAEDCRESHVVDQQAREFGVLRELVEGVLDIFRQRREQRKEGLLDFEIEGVDLYPQ